MALRVVQWTTGQIGRDAVQGILAHPELELVGCYAWSPDKAGKDVGELCGIEPTGVIATDDVDELIALRPDAVLYMPMRPNADEMVRIMDGGINLVTTASFITGRSYGEKRMEQLRDAAERNGVSLYGTGINPGLASVVALCASAACRDVERITILEAADCTGYESGDTWRAVGFGSHPDAEGLTESARRQTGVFGDALEMMAEALSMELDGIDFRLETGLATEHLDLGYMEIEQGHVCGMTFVWTGTVGGRPLIELGLRWRLGNSMEPDWPIEHGYTIEIEAVPNIQMRLVPDEAEYASHTANPAVNAVPAVVAAPPGLVLAGDLPLIAAGSVKPRD